jgi:hypothetical protein
MSFWHQGKLFIEHMVAFSHDSIHIFAGVLLWVAAGLMLRRPLTSWLPWLCPLAAILWNEWVDLTLEHWPDPGQQFGEGVKDVLLTMLLPTLLMFAARFRPDLFRAGARKGRRH